MVGYSNIVYRMVACIHEYGLVKCVLMAVFTLVAAIVILFAVALLFDLYRRIFSFVYTVYREISLRYF